MVKKIAVSWSAHRFDKLKCQSCKKTGSQRIIQAQDKYTIGKFSIRGKGKRYFMRSCDNCHSLYTLNKQELRIAKKLKYFNKKPKGFEDPKDRIVSQASSNVNVLYPILTESKWDELRKENKKEGFLSVGLGIVFSLLLSPFFQWWWVIALLFTLGGLYAAYEDPEHKHRNHFEKTGEIR